MSHKPRNLAEERLGATVSKPVMVEVPAPSAPLHPPTKTPAYVAAAETGKVLSAPPSAGPPVATPQVIVPHATGHVLPDASLQPLLFECAWEVCWQLGGIYTVLKTKAPAMQRRWDDRYFLVGPYNPATAAVEFEERPTEGWIRVVLDRLREAGMPAHYGQWLIPGRPKAILLDHRARFGNLHNDKYLMWKDHHISTDASDGEVNEVIAFGFAVTEFFRILTEVQPGRPVLAHFHEWMGGVAVPRIAHLKIPVTTIFTTHATLLGRYLASDYPDFYSNLDHIDPDKEAARYNIYPRFAIERAAAHASTVFTTVSEVTAVEAEKLLGRPADVILPNGLNIQRFTALHEFQNLHRAYKEKIHKFVMGHFFPSYTFDLDRVLYVFTSGRYEYRNKGMDMFIESLWRLNQRLRNIPAPPTVVAFIITRAATRNINVQVLQNQSMFEDLQNTCHQVEKDMGEVLFRAAATGRMPTFQELLTQDNNMKLKRAMHAWRTSRQPTIVTHDMVDDNNDPILKHLRYRHMFNAADDPVKIVFHPEFASATSPLLNLDYEQFVRGCHVGLFPSYYEPWGYTPMEALAMGVPAVTTDLCGFGNYVERHISDAESQGIKVLKRRWQGFDQCSDDMCDYLMSICQLSRRQRIELRNRAERLSEMFDWTQLAQHYHDAHQMALERMNAPHSGSIDVRLV